MQGGYYISRNDVNAIPNDKKQRSLSVAECRCQSVVELRLQPKESPLMLVADGGSVLEASLRDRVLRGELEGRKRKPLDSSFDFVDLVPTRVLLQLLPAVIPLVAYERLDHLGVRAPAIHRLHESAL